MFCTSIATTEGDQKEILVLFIFTFPDPGQGRKRKSILIVLLFILTLLSLLISLWDFVGTTLYKKTYARYE